MIRNIVFDLGGVVVDLDIHLPIQRFTEIGVADAAELMNPYEHRGIFLDFENGKLDLEGFRAALSAHAGKEFTTEQITYAWMGYMKYVPPYKLDYLQELRKRYNVYILSNNNPAIMGWARSTAFTPEGRSLSDYADKLYLSYEIGITKPDPRIFEYMMKDAGILPEETLFVDDGKRNIDTAISLGMHTYQPLNEEDWRGALDDILG